MFKRIALFAVTNILVVVTISIVLRLLGIGHYVGPYGLNYGSLAVFCLVWGMGGAFISLAISRLMAKWSMGVRVIDPRDPGEFRELVATVHALAQKAKLPAMPEVGVYDSPDVNAFATGPTKSRALVAVSTGLLRNMDRDEVEGVLGHEIAHVANGDMVTMTLVQGVINAFVMFFARIAAFAISSTMRGKDDRGGSYMMQFLLVTVFEIVFGILGYIVVAWFSRLREFRADRGGAIFAGKGKMIAALQRLQQAYGRAPEAAQQGAALATMKISGRQGGLVSLMATHPPLEARIARLREG
ncbi:MAG TPA: protease HtpX [Fibrobacteria bacterium]|jgi:heat shock protein HtpX|nr:protease HtpX [Fibrobacteria bacterium]